MHNKQKQKIWNSSTNGDLFAIGCQFTAKWHKLLASLFLYRHVTRIQPADFIAKRPIIDKLAQTDSDCLQPLVNLPERLVYLSQIWRRPPTRWPVQLPCTWMGGCTDSVGSGQPLGDHLANGDHKEIQSNHQATNFSSLQWGCHLLFTLVWVSHYENHVLKHEHEVETHFYVDMFNNMIRMNAYIYSAATLWQTINWYKWSPRFVSKHMHLQ